jgi:hypothetical protein
MENINYDDVIVREKSFIKYMLFLPAFTPTKARSSDGVG